jgi:hypothetical protein
MRVPDNEKDLLDFSRDLIEQCTHSQSSRAQDAAINLSYYEKGSATGESLYNRTGVHIDRTASYLYAPGEVRYSIAFDATDGDPWLSRAAVASKYLSREYRRSDADIRFSQGVKNALIKGCTILKHNWLLSESLDAHLIHPEFFGVEREDLDRLEDQQAIVHTTYLTKNQIRQRVQGQPGEADILKQMLRLGGVEEDNQRRNWLHQVVIGGTTPVQVGTAGPGRDQVSMTPSSRTDFHPDMMANLLRMDELWVLNDERDDYTTIQLIEGEALLEGKYRHRNLSGVKGMLPFSKICADSVSGYFWGRSEVGRVMMLQDLLTERMEDIQRLLRLQIKQPKAFIGFSGLTSQKMRAALAPGGFIQEQSPGATIQNLGPTIPDEIFKEVQMLSMMFDEIGGFKPILQGQGEPGVRANAHAQTLMKTASPNLRERSLCVERNAEDSAHITFKLMQEKDARVFMTGEKEQFLLKQMPDDYYIEVDSHSASPAFSDDAREIAFALKKMGAIDEEGLIRMTHPPMEDMLLANLKKRQEARAKMIKEHPELMQQGKKKA